MDRSEALDLLPRVGTPRMEIPSEWCGDKEDKHPIPCVVIKVNRRGLWYMVKFESGIRECYKVPQAKRWGEEAPSKAKVEHQVKRKKRKK